MNYAGIVDRAFWRRRIENAWGEAPIVWLCGARRCGKTTLASSLGADLCLYVDCDLPAVEDMVRDVAARLNAEGRIDAYVVESENFESIHNHSAYALIEKDKRQA